MSRYVEAIIWLAIIYGLLWFTVARKGAKHSGAWFIAWHVIPIVLVSLWLWGRR
jgi:hypothetical protein